MRGDFMEKVFEYPLKIEVLYRDEPQLEITLLSFNKVVSKLLIEKPKVFVPISIYPENITINSFNDFLESRLPDKTRSDIDDILKRYGLRFFNPIQMCMKSYGRNMSDFLWLRFNDKKETFADIRLR